MLPKLPHKGNTRFMYYFLCITFTISIKRSVQQILSFVPGSRRVNVTHNHSLLSGPNRNPNMILFVWVEREEDG